MSDINDLFEPRAAQPGASRGPGPAQPGYEQPAYGQPGPAPLPYTTPPSGETGGFSSFIIGAFHAIVGVLFFAVWLGVSLPLIGMVSSMFRYDAAALAPLLYLLAIAFGFVIAVSTTGFAVLILDIRKQLVAIRKSLSGR